MTRPGFEPTISHINSAKKGKDICCIPNNVMSAFFQQHTHTYKYTEIPPLSPTHSQCLHYRQPLPLPFHTRITLGNSSRRTLSFLVFGIIAHSAAADDKPLTPRGAVQFSPVPLSSGEQMTFLPLALPPHGRHLVERGGGSRECSMGMRGSAEGRRWRLPVSCLFAARGRCGAGVDVVMVAVLLVSEQGPTMAA